MRTNRHSTIARAGRLTASLLVLTLAAAVLAAGETRVRIEFEMDPALQMGDRVTTVVPLRTPGEDQRILHSELNFRRTIGTVFWSRPYIYYIDGTYDGPTLIGQAARLEDAPRLTTPRPRAVSSATQAADALAEGRYGEAIDHYRPIFEADASDRGAWAALVLALEGAGRTGEAARLLSRRLLLVEPDEVAGTLAFGRESLLGGPAELRRLRALAAEYAERTGDPDGYLLLASHLWAMGRDEAATRAIERAVELGLDPALVQRLERLD